MASQHPENVPTSGAEHKDALYEELLAMRPGAEWGFDDLPAKTPEEAEVERVAVKAAVDALNLPPPLWPVTLPRCTLPEPALENVRRHWWIRAPLGETLEQEVKGVLVAVEGRKDAFVCGATQLTRMDGYDGESLVLFPGTRCTPPSSREAADLAQPYTWFSELTTARFYMCTRTGKAIDRKPGLLRMLRARTMVVITHMELPDQIMMRLLFNAVDVGPEVVRAPEPVPEHERLEEEALRALTGTAKPPKEPIVPPSMRARWHAQPIDWDTWIFDAPH